MYTYMYNTHIYIYIYIYIYRYREREMYLDILGIHTILITIRNGKVGRAATARHHAIPCPYQM